MQHRKTINSFAVAALFTTMTFSPGCGGKSVATDKARSISVDVEAQLHVPRIRQSGTRNNCGPTTAAMVLAAYRGVEDKTQLRALRDMLGAWSFEKHALRRLRLPNVRGGMTPESVLIDTLNEHSDDVTFGPLDPNIAYLRDTLTSAEQSKRAWDRLKAAVVGRRPVLAMVQSKILWPDSSESLHWVVVTGLSDDQVIINDPADGGTDAFSVDRFMRGWRLNPFFRTLPIVHSYGAIVGDQPLPNTPQDSPPDLVANPEAARMTALASVSNCTETSVRKCR